MCCNTIPAKVKLLGNSMHLTVVGSIVTFVLSNILRKDVVENIMPPVFTMKSDSDDESASGSHDC